LTDNPLADSEVTPSDIGDAEADGENRDNDLLRAVLTGLAIFSILNMRWSHRGRELDGPELLDRLAAEEQERALDLYAALSGGAIDAARWLADMTTNLRRFHLQSTAIGRGGFDAITQTDLDRLSGFLETEFGYLRGFADEIANLSEAQVKARLQQYHNHAQATFWEATRETMGELGSTEERRVLNPAEHCGDCEGYAGQGWQPIGTLPPPGQASECRSNCRCSLEFR
jgi:hypothetical protein